MKVKKLLPIVLCCFLLSGCWDKVEIDRRMFISTIGIDIGRDISKEKDLKNINPEEPFAERQIKKINITYGFPDISAAGGEASKTAEEKSINVDAYSMEDGIAQATNESSRNMHLGHTKLLVLSSRIMNYPNVVKEIMDYLERNPHLNRNMMVVIAEGKAEDYIKFKPDMEKNIESYISGLMENSKRSATIFPMDLNDFLILLSENGNALVPRLTMDKENKELNLSGVAVIKDYKLEGNLTPIETSDIEILRGKLKGGKKVIYKEGHPIDLSIDGIERNIRIDKKDNKLVFDVSIALEGQMKGFYAQDKVFTKENLAQLEDAFSKSLSEECEKIAKFVRDDFEIDPFGFREYIEKFKPFLWNEIKDNWQDNYKNSIINVKVKTKIRRIGVVE